MAHTAAELRVLRRTFMNDSEKAIKSFNGASLLPGQSPDKLFEDAMLSYEKVNTAYREVIEGLSTDDADADKLEDSKDIVDDINSKLGSLKALHAAYKLEHLDEPTDGSQDEMTKVWL